MLPVFQGNKDVIVRRQTVSDIQREVLTSHRLFAGDYQRIAEMFAGRSVPVICKKLFDFCKQNLPYQAESDDLQTTRSPGGVLSIAAVGGSSDCKHYAGFIAGVLDALNKAGFNIDWTYRFCSYSWKNSTPGHVYVVVFFDGREIWVDPAPVEEKGAYREREYDDRFVEPVFYTDEKPNMALTRLSGCRYGSGSTVGLHEQEGQQNGYGGGGGYSNAGSYPSSDPVFNPDVVDPELSEFEYIDTDTFIDPNTGQVIPITTADPGPKSNFFVDFIRANPTTSMAIGLGLVWGAYELFFKNKKRRS